MILASTLLNLVSLDKVYDLNIVDEKYN